MTLSQMVVAGSALVIVLLTVVVVRLSRQLAELSRRVEDLRSAPEPARPTAPSPTSSSSVPAVDPQPVAEKPAREPPPGLTASHQVDERDEDVRVITHLDGAETERDLTTARIASVTLGGPLIKVAALSHGVRRALREEHRMRVAYVVRKEMRRQRKIRRRRGAERAPSEGLR